MNKQRNTEFKMIYVNAIKFMFTIRINALLVFFSFDFKCCQDVKTLNLNFDKYLITNNSNTDIFNGKTIAIEKQTKKPKIV